VLARQLKAAWALSRSPEPYPPLHTPDRACWHGRAGHHAPGQCASSLPYTALSSTPHAPQLTSTRGSCSSATAHACATLPWHGGGWLGGAAGLARQRARAAAWTTTRQGRSGALAGTEGVRSPDESSENASCGRPRGAHHAGCRNSQCRASAMPVSQDLPLSVAATPVPGQDPRSQPPAARRLRLPPHRDSTPSSAGAHGDPSAALRDGAGAAATSCYCLTLWRARGPRARLEGARGAVARSLIVRGHHRVLPVRVRRGGRLRVLRRLAVALIARQRHCAPAHRAQRQLATSLQTA